MPSSFKSARGQRSSDMAKVTMVGEWGPFELGSVNNSGEHSMSRKLELLSAVFVIENRQTHCDSMALYAALIRGSSMGANRRCVKEIP